MRWQQTFSPEQPTRPLPVISRSPATLLRQADMPVLFDYARRLMGREDHEVHRRRASDESPVKAEKVFARMPGAAETLALHARDGWRCRFCGCRVVSGRARSAVRASLPGALPWGEGEGYHAAFFAMTASVDHVVPHSAGGTNEPGNLVTACWSVSSAAVPTQFRSSGCWTRATGRRWWTAGMASSGSSGRHPWRWSGKRMRTRPHHLSMFSHNTRSEPGKSAAAIGNIQFRAS